MQDKPTAPYGYCQCGCGGKAPLYRQTNRNKGYRRGDPRRYIHGHSNRPTGSDYVIDANGCWVWQRYINDAGYGIQYVNGNRFRAHRFYYERHNGPIPDGLTLDHLCRNRACVNPAHLEPVTIAENCRRGATAILTPAQVRFVKASTMRVTDIAELLGVSTPTISGIRSGHRWSDV